MRSPFNILWTVALGLVLLLAPASSAQANVSVTMSAGLNACVADDDPADCSRIDNSGMGGLGVFYQVLPKLELGLDLRFGALSPHEDPSSVEQSITTFHMTPTAVWREPIADRYAVEGRLGFGYSSSTLAYKSVTGTEAANTWVSWATAVLGVAGSMEVIDQLEAGLGLDLYLQDGGTMCTKTTGTACTDHTDPMSELFNAYIFARYRL
ncbi:MAG: hypothetical protein CL940_10900 [Deltaproteobacteria bacterium]|mgnify:FL=1|nr:hypothetical protein [Deltaproteobacteria bacterium]